MANTINGKQKDAINSGTEPIMVVAGAGSGKTFVLTQRIMHLITNNGVLPNKILAFTFTNKAANEIKTRVSTIINNFYFRWIGTFHSICLKILREDSDIINRANNFLVIDEDDQLSIIREIYLTENLSRDRLSIKKCLSIVSQLKSRNIYNQDDAYSFLERDENLYKVRDIVWEVLKNYIKYLEEKNYFDFDDLIKSVNKIFDKSSDTLKKWKSRFSYILVDEFQDTNEEQFELIKKLVNNNENVFVVGDPDQMIYSWRGAMNDIFSKFKNYYSNAKTIILDQNYRSSQTILDISNRLIGNNKQRIEKDLFTKNEEGNNVVYFEANNQDSESKWIIEKINFLINKENFKYSDIAILYRSNYLSRNIEQFLFRRNIPYIVYGGLKFYRRKEIKDILAYLKYISINDDVSLARIYNVPKRKFSLKTYDELVKYAKQNELFVHDVLINHLDKIDAIGKAAKNSCQEFNLMIQKMKDFKYLTISDLIDYIISLTKYDKYLDEENENYRMDNINELKNAINLFQQENPNSTLYDYLQEVALYSDEENQSKNNDFITLMSVHSAKGLEFNNVFILAFNEETFPSKKSIDGDEIEEERRIAYVAMTRAKQNLFISCHGGINFQNNNLPKTPSRFISEISKAKSLEMIKENNAFNSKSDFLRVSDNYQFYSNNKFIAPEENYHEEDVLFEMGDTIEHSTFGKGLVISVFEDKLTISFQPPYGKKTLMKLHKAIKKL